VSYQDKTLTCVDCGSPFTFTAGEQEFHASKGFTNEPRRCPSCRQARRASGGGGGSYSSGSGSYSSSYGQREFFTATCASCGREARVPFQPRGDKPVYCSDCFRSQGGGGSRSGSYGGARGGGGGRDRDRW
jgi:CxxC-x17-CxxC domain-containing protein